MVIAEKKHKITMDEDVFSVFGRHEDKIPIHHKEGTRLEGTGRGRPLGGEEEREALITIYNNHNKYQLIRLPAIAEHNVKHLSWLVRNYDYTNKFNCAETKIKEEELRNFLEGENLGQKELQLVAEAENANIDILLTFNPTLIKEVKKVKAKGVLKIDIMKPSAYVQKYL